MSRTQWIRSAAALAFVALVLTAVPTADAACSALKQFGQYNFFDNPGNYGYIRFGAGESSPTGGPTAHAGSFWQLGNRSSNGDGCPINAVQADGGWIQYFGGGGHYLAGNLTSGCIQGCPLTELVVTVLDKIDGEDAARFAVLRTEERILRGIQFDMSPNQGPGGEQWPVDVFAADIPKPRVTASSRSGSTVNVDIAFDDIVAGYYDGGRGTDPYAVITGYQLYTQTVLKTDPAPPRDSTSGWALAQTVATGAGGSSLPGFGVDCSDPNTIVLLAVGLEIDGYSTEYVGAAQSVECDPNLADPKAPRFRLVERPDKPGRSGRTIAPRR